MLEIFNPGKFILSFYSTEVYLFLRSYKNVVRPNNLPLQDSVSFPLHEELKSCTQLQKWKRNELQICNNEVPLNLLIIDNSSSPGLGALLCKLCCYSYLGLVAPGSSGTDIKLYNGKANGCAKAVEEFPILT